MANLSDAYDFVNVKLKSDVSNQINQICEDCKKELGIAITKSDLLRILLNDSIVIEYAVKQYLLKQDEKKS